MQEHIERLSQHPFYKVRAAVARWQHTPLHTIQYLLKLGKPHASIGAASHQNIFNIKQNLGQK